MLQIAKIKQNPEEIAQRLNIRGIDGKQRVQELLDLDEKRRSLQQQKDDLLASMNTISAEIGELFKKGNREEAELKKGETTSIKESVKRAEVELKEVETQLTDLLNDTPNAPDRSVQPGLSEKENVEVFAWGDVPELGEMAKPHWEIASDANIIDFELGVKITGAGFPVYMGVGAKFQRALINFFLDEAGKAGYKEVQVPIMVNENSAYATGQLPDKEGQMYHATVDDLYIIPTAEVPVTNIFRDTILKESELPQKLTGYTPCFRREAGSYGKEVRGLNRLHQFDKVEIVQVVHPNKSYVALDEMVEHVKGLMEKLELPYRILLLCGGDMGFTSAKTFDFEVWSAAQQRWLEVSSTSCFESYQSNRLKCRFKNSETGKNELVHTLNGSAMALPRIVAALLENNQKEGNKVRIPKALQSYLGMEEIAY